MVVVDALSVMPLHRYLLWRRLIDAESNCEG
jgi:hypothetical protein